MYERVNINCAEVNSTRQMGSGIYFFISVDTRTDGSHIEKWPVLSYNKWAAENDAAEGGNLFAERSGYRYLKITIP